MDMGQQNCDRGTPSAKCKSGTTVLLVHHKASWSSWSPLCTLIHLGTQFPECGYTKWSKQNQGGPAVVQGHRQDHGAGWWTRSVQDHHGPLKNFFLMDLIYNSNRSARAGRTGRTGR